MSARDVIAILVTLLAAGLVWWGWDDLRLLRGTFLWEVRFVAFGVGAIAIITAAEWLAVKAAAVWSRIKPGA